MTKQRSLAAGGGYAKAVESARATLEEENKKAQQRAFESKMQVLGNEPILGLVFPALEPAFDQANGAWEGMLHDEIGRIKNTLNELHEHVRQDVPFAVKQWPTVKIEEPPTLAALAALDSPSHGFEAELADRAVVGLSNGQTAWFPLASANTWHELVAREEIEADSLGYVVYVHYVQALEERLDKEEREREASRQFWLTFSRLLAAMSLVTLVTPASRLLNALSVMGGLVAQAQSFWSIASDIQRVRTLYGLAAAEAGSTLEALGRLGELLAVRNDLVEGLGEEVVLGLLMHLVGQSNIRLVQRSLLAYGLHQDLETLLVSDDTQLRRGPRPRPSMRRRAGARRDAAGRNLSRLTGRTAAPRSRSLKPTGKLDPTAPASSNPGPARRARRADQASGGQARRAHRWASRRGDRRSQSPGAQAAAERHAQGGGYRELHEHASIPLERAAQFSTSGRLSRCS